MSRSLVETVTPELVSCRTRAKREIGALGAKKFDPVESSYQKGVREPDFCSYNLGRKLENFQPGSDRIFKGPGSRGVKRVFHDSSLLRRNFFFLRSRRKERETHRECSSLESCLPGSVQHTLYQVRYPIQNFKFCHWGRLAHSRHNKQAKTNAL
ncbi:hypothetical protein BDP27DRAFT_1399729, partial [Rhodocollybia butyracea]